MSAHRRCPEIDGWKVVDKRTYPPSVEGAEHFLRRLNRLAGSEVDLALFWDSTLLRAVLGRVPLPEGAERIALSLDDPTLGPFLVVTRDGHLVTCLGRGMKAGGLPVLTRGQLDAELGAGKASARWRGGSPLCRPMNDLRATTVISLAVHPFETYGAVRMLPTSLIDQALEATCAPGRLPGRDQLRTNRFGLHLSWLWALQGVRGRKSNIHVYASAHAMPNGSHLDEIRCVLEREDAKLHEYGFLVDVWIERSDRKRRLTNGLVAAEIEASPVHGVQYVYEGPDYSDYLWDFSKLLYVRAPKRLFVGCTTKERLDDLQATLVAGYRDAALPYSDHAAVVLLPAGETEKEHVRLGTSSRGRLVFKKPYEAKRRLMGS